MGTTVELDIYSPRWGHNDRYTVILDDDFMEISSHQKKTIVTYRQDEDPVWTGQPLEKTMMNDHIYPPAITQDLFERAWEAWRNDELNNQQVENELKAISTWINEVTNSKPKTEFWNRYF